MGMAAQLFELLGKVDNLNDPIPPLNRRSLSYGLILVFLVSGLPPPESYLLHIHTRVLYVIPSSYRGSKTHQAQIFALSSASARLYVRLRVTKCAWWDDLFIVLSMVRKNYTIWSTVIN